ncbi:hypothetical protein [Butyrivibrio fibrisolvens]|uniref:hypothetical protein n=1 Tax=Butyrivibrio fibrisolvens TaxID=831 RepID=UPI0003B51338|nr:hypothetical protein [Butyrivibrio fibrisolvens]
MQSSKKRTLLNICIAAGITAVIMLQIAALFDYYFDLNDDVLMMDILSGSYTGTPAAHNIQMLYPISALISLFYRLFKGADVYGIFLCICQYGCMFLIFRRTLDLIDNKMSRIVAVIFEVVFAIGCIMGHFVYVQYTFIVAMMAGTAAFLVITGSGRSNRILVCLIIWLSFLVRSEMLLLMLPFAGMAWGYRFITDFEAGDKKKIRTVYIRWAIVLFLGLIVCKEIDIIAYSYDRWPEFRNLFDARTELYDYQTIPDYDGNEEFYDSIGLDKTEVELLFNYNFGLDEEIDSDIMGQVAAYAKSIKEETPMPVRIQKAIGKYIYRLHHFGFQESFEYPQTDAPWNFIILIMYLAIFFAALSKKKSGLFTISYLAILFIIRSLLWMYILVGERDPIRVTHGLMFTEAILLFGIIARMMSFEDRKVYTRGGILLLIVLTLVYIPNAVNVSRAEALVRADVCDPYTKLYDYIGQHQQNFYWIDVYTSVSYSEKMFADTDNSLDNYDILGGWACKSPLQDAKLKAFGYSDIQSSLLTANAYLVIRSEYSTDWLVAYYNDKGIKITLDEADTIAGEFRIIKVSTS